MNVVFLSLLLITELSAGCSGEFHVVFKHFQNLENLILNKQKLHISLWALFSLKPYKAFGIAQSKQPRLVKPCLNFDLYFIFKTSGTDLIETIVSYKPLSSPSSENRKSFPQRL